MSSFRTLLSHVIAAVLPILFPLRKYDEMRISFSSQQQRKSIQSTTNHHLSLAPNLRCSRRAHSVAVSFPSPNDAFFPVSSFPPAVAFSDASEIRYHPPERVSATICDSFRERGTEECLPLCSPSWSTSLDLPLSRAPSGIGSHGTSTSIHVAIQTSSSTVGVEARSPPDDVVAFDSENGSREAMGAGGGSRN